MSLNHHHRPTLEQVGQSPGHDPKAAKRNSGIFSFLKWFKPSTSRESIDNQSSSSSSGGSISSVHSNGTIASFSYVPPSAYPPTADKCICPGPETDTYRARLKQRDRRRENDKNLTLRKKYNLFFSKGTLLKGAPPAAAADADESTRSLPLMTRAPMDEAEQKLHRRTNSESSKIKRAGAYLHVKGKRRAPQPPSRAPEGGSTLSLRRKKRVAPPPPPGPQVSADDDDAIFNDSLKLEHGLLKPAGAAPAACAQSSFSPPAAPAQAPVSPRLWYKRNAASGKAEHKYEPVEKLPEVPFIRSADPQGREDRRKSRMSFLTNISELDREASEIVKKEHQRMGSGGGGGGEMPMFMRPRDDANKAGNDSWAPPKRRSARDLIAKFNAITNVTKVTVNSAIFGPKEQRRDYFGKAREGNPEGPRGGAEPADRSRPKGECGAANPLMKSESASAIKAKPETPKLERKSWNCPKCSIENDYWRIICHVCSTIKPYFDDFTPSSPKTKEAPITDVAKMATIEERQDRALERSRTQIGFSALATYKQNKEKEKAAKDEKNVSETDKKDEREKLKRMLIEMKNSLPKRKSHILMKQNSRSSIIIENPENEEAAGTAEPKHPAAAAKDEGAAALPKLGEIGADGEKQNLLSKNSEKSQGERVAKILIGTKTTIYENIKVKNLTSEVPKSTKLSTTSSVQTNSALEQPTLNKNNHHHHSPKATIRNNNFELMRPKDFENIYTDNNINGQSPARIYANLAQNDELSLFFNVPKKLTDIKNNISCGNVSKNTDTIEVNRLLRKLESSIAKGELVDAAMYAKELAQLKISCSVVRQKPQCMKKQGFNIEMYVEDKLSHRGPFNLEVTESQTVAELKSQVEKEFEIPANVQRWILGKELASKDGATLKDHNVCAEGCPVFLYLVAPADVKGKNEFGSKVAAPSNAAPSTSKSQLLEIDDRQGQKSGSSKESAEETPLLAEILAETSTLSNDSLNAATVEDHTPKIVNVIPKASHSPKTEAGSEATQNGYKSCQTACGSDRQSKIAKPGKNILDHEFEDYDSKTLKPQPKEWACHLCTLLNPVSSNVCAVCAAVRQKETAAVLKKSAKQKAPSAPKAADNASGSAEQTYMQLVHLDNADLVENVDIFECLVCLMEVRSGHGVTLRECLHQFCKQCLAQTIEYTEEAEIRCPYRDDEYSCNIALQDREIKALVTPAVYDQYLAKSVAQAENAIGKSFHCKTPDCKGWCIFEDNVNDFKCPVCKRINCLTCQAIHSGMNCKQYQERMKQASEVDDDAKRTKEMLEEMVGKGEALTCPTCQVILMKKWGCDWLRCSMCKTEICWVTRGPRWGPGGKGDTTGGCQCGMNGVKCHPQCNYCH